MKIVCAVFILKEDGSALLQHRDNIPNITHPGKWTIPGGHRQPDEPLEDCAKREVLEETGYRIHWLKPVISTTHDDGDNIQYPLHIFWTHYDGRQHVSCLEGQGVAFMTPAQAKTKPFLDFLFPYWDRSIILMKEEGIGG